MKRNQQPQQQTLGDFIVEISKSPLDEEEKIETILQFATTTIQVPQQKRYPSWIEDYTTKCLLEFLSINPKGTFFTDNQEQQEKLHVVASSLSELYTLFIGENDKLFEHLETRVNLLSGEYGKWTRTTLLQLLSALENLVDSLKRNVSERVVSGLWNTLFSCLVHSFPHFSFDGNREKLIQFYRSKESSSEIQNEDAPSLSFVVKPDFFVSSPLSKIILVREDTSDNEESWEKTDSKKLLLTIKSLLQNAIHSDNWNKEDLKKYSKIMGFVANRAHVHMFVLEVDFTEKVLDGDKILMEPNYKLSKLLQTHTVNPNNIILIGMQVLNFLKNHVQTRIYSIATRNLSVLDTNVGKKMSNLTSLAANNVLLSTSKGNKKRKIWDNRPVVEILCDSNERTLYKLSSFTITKKIEKDEAYIYSMLLNTTDYSQYLPSILKLTNDFVETERLEELPKNWNEESIILFLRDISKALRFLHTHNIIHRDVKPSNTMVRKHQHRYQFVLIDFGLAVHYKQDVDQDETILIDQFTNEMLTYDVGTPHFQAPEIVEDEVIIESTYNEKVDIYSLGLTVVALLNPKEFFTATDIPGCIDSIQEIGDLLKGVLKKMTSMEAKERPTSMELESLFSDMGTNNNTKKKKKRR